MGKDNIIIDFRDDKEAKRCQGKYVVFDPQTKKVLKDSKGAIIADKNPQNVICRAENIGFKIIGNINQPDEKIYVCVYIPRDDEIFIFLQKEDRMFDRRKIRKNGGGLSTTEILGSILNRHDEDCWREE